MEDKKVFSIPFEWKLPLAWLLFFTILGIIIQSIQTNSFVFLDFFWKNYGIWFRGLGSFVSSSTYSSPQALMSTLFSGWYYFFYSGGIISVIWEMISSLVNLEVKFEKKERMRTQVLQEKIRY